MKNWLILTTITIVSFFSFLFSQSNEFDPEKGIVVQNFVSYEDNSQSDQFNLALLIIVPKGYHITDSDYFFVKRDSSSSYKFEQPIYPQKIKYKNSFVYQDSVIVFLKGKFTDKGIKENITIGYQICSEEGEEVCFMPVERVIEFSVADSKDNPYIFKNTTEDNSKLQNSNNIASSELASSEEDLLANRISGLKKWSILIFVLAFLGGILDSFTPCVYPIIPVVISYMGAKASGTKRAGFVLSLFFVLGLAITYSLVGTIVAFLGGIIGIGDIAYNPWVLGTIATIFLVLATSMFGFWDMNFISSDKKSKLMRSNFTGVGGAVLLGMVSGVVAAPCVGPVLAALLIHVATEGDILYGWLLLLSFAFGLGMLFLVIGTFSGALNALPKAGAWMVNIKKFFGVMMVGAAFYFLSFVIPKEPLYLAAGFLLILFALFIGALSSLNEDSKPINYFAKALGLCLIIIGSWLIFVGVSSYIKPTFALSSEEKTNSISKSANEVEFIVVSQDSTELISAFERAKNENKMVLLDFWATWCPNCIELDKTVWNQPEIKEAVEKSYIAVKADLSDNNSFSKWVKEKYKNYGANNPPLVLFVSPNGKVVSESRGLVSKEVMLQRINNAITISNNSK